MGYGHLGAFRTHVRGRTNALLSLRRPGYRPMLGYLVMRTKFSGDDHYGMPRWPGIAISVRELLLTPEHPAWLSDSPTEGASSCRGADGTVQPWVVGARSSQRFVDPVVVLNAHGGHAERLGPISELSSEERTALNLMATGLAH